MTAATRPMYKDGRERRRDPVGSRVTALAVALLLGAACFPLALFALWPGTSAGDNGLAQALPEVVLLGLAGLAAVTALRWAAGVHGRGAVAASRLIGLTPCLLVTIELLRR